MTVINKTVGENGEVIEQTPEEIAAAEAAKVAQDQADADAKAAADKVIADAAAKAAADAEANGEPALVELSDEIKSFIVKSVESATAETTKESVLLKSLVASKDEEIATLKKQYADLLASPAANGPKKTGVVEKSAVDKTALRDAELEFARLTNLAKSVTDVQLAKGYSLLAEEQQGVIAELNKSK